MTRNGKIRTETARRDDDFNVSVSTSPRTNTTKVFIDAEDGTTMELTGRGMRTLLRVLLKHYDALDKTTAIPIYDRFSY